ncbi:MAG: hypothetical protein Q8922_15205 [Bacteroidota bacterium]|nr:hypothetical protein [Bacteroidota bacterium]MDP4234049.1 hypothetical protein [Bacteroidota bacterium]MDP4242915.1 hypothetical protein [Bacteroidota bacterium]MDP4289264.1 hypothetical protein [Bacteroidota bacterium]
MENETMDILDVEDIRPLLAALVTGLNTLSAESFNTASQKTYYDAHITWLTGVIRFSMAQRLLAELGLRFGYPVIKTHSRATLITKHFSVHLCRLSSRKQLPRESKEKTSTAQYNLFTGTPDALPERLYLVIGFVYSTSGKKTLEERLSQPALIQAGLPLPDWTGYALEPAQISEYLAREPKAEKPRINIIDDTIREALRKRAKKIKRNDNEQSSEAA